MSHTKGPNEKVIDDLAAAFAREVDASSRANGTSITESMDATFHEQQRLFHHAARRWPGHMQGLFRQKLATLQAGVMELAKTALAPWEDETCPTCPKKPRGKK